MEIVYLLMVGGLVALTGSALMAFRWALQRGEFKHPAKIALQIFDEEEPVGVMSDSFPGVAHKSAPTNVEGA